MERTINIEIQKNGIDDFGKLKEFIAKHWKDGVLMIGEFNCLFFSKSFQIENGIRVTHFLKCSSFLELRHHRDYSGTDTLDEALKEYYDILMEISEKGMIAVTYVDDIADWEEIEVF